MPTYEYRCQECGSDLEVVQSIHEDSLTECPTCGGKLRKLFGNVGIVFKGSGFYRTDNRAKSKSGGSRPASKSEKTEKTEKPAASTSAASKPAGGDSGSSSSGGSGGSSSVPAQPSSS
ncbi:MAG: FmdB family zinc ribbon protein [Candidatus Nanopelagicales bacterium]